MNPQGLKCYAACDSKTRAACGGAVVADASMTCDDQYPGSDGNKADAACVKVTM